MIAKGQNKKSMAYVGNVVAFIKDRIEKEEPGYNVFNYADKPVFNMKEFSSIIEEKMKLSIPIISIPYWLGMLGGYGFELLAFSTRKKKVLSGRSTCSFSWTMFPWWRERNSVMVWMRPTWSGQLTRRMAVGLRMVCELRSSD